MGGDGQGGLAGGATQSRASVSPLQRVFVRGWGGPGGRGAPLGPPLALGGPVVSPASTGSSQPSPVLPSSSAAWSAPVRVSQVAGGHGWRAGWWVRCAACGWGTSRDAWVFFGTTPPLRPESAQPWMRWDPSEHPCIFSALLPVLLRLRLAGWSGGNCPQQRPGFHYYYHHPSGRVSEKISPEKAHPKYYLRPMCFFSFVCPPPTFPYHPQAVLSILSRNRRHKARRGEARQGKARPRRHAARPAAEPANHRPLPLCCVAMLHVGRATPPACTQYLPYRTDRRGLLRLLTSDMPASQPTTFAKCLPVHS